MISERLPAAVLDALSVAHTKSITCSPPRRYAPGDPLWHFFETVKGSPAGHRSRSGLPRKRVVMIYIPAEGGVFSVDPVIPSRPHVYLYNRMFPTRGNFLNSG